MEDKILKILEDNSSTLREKFRNWDVKAVREERFEEIAKKINKLLTKNK